MPRILLIDDCMDMLGLNRMLLESRGYEVETAISGEAALRALTEIGRPDLILLDYKMPAMTGPQFLEHFTVKFPDLAMEVPVIMMTALPTLPDSIQVPHLSKSLRPKEFLSRVSNFVAAPI